MYLPPLYLLVGFVVGQRLGELWLASRNTRRLKAAGAVEIGARHYPLFVILHLAWLAAILWFVPPSRQPYLPLVAFYLLLQLGRIWVISSLGGFWTTRIIHMPGQAVVRTGPFRFVRHPNYLVVAGEIAALPLAFGAWRIALVFSLLSALLTLYRIRVEESALATRPGWTAS